MKVVLVEPKKNRRKIYAPEVGERISEIQQECFRIIPKDYRLAALVMIDEAEQMFHLVDKNESFKLMDDKKYFNATVEGKFSTKIIFLSQTWRNIKYLRDAKQALLDCGALDYLDFSYNDPEPGRDPRFPEFDTQKLRIYHSAEDIYVLNPIFTDFRHKAIYGITDFDIDTGVSKYDAMTWLSPGDIGKFVINT